MGVCQNGDGAGVRDCVDTAQLHVDFQANVREILQFRARALGALEALGSDALNDVAEAVHYDQRVHIIGFSVAPTA